MVNEIKKKDQNPGGPADFITSAPYGYSSVIAAAKLADNLKYKGSQMAVTSSGAYEGHILTNGLDSVRGYATILWIGDDLTEGEKLSNAEHAKQPTPKPEESTT